MLPSAPRSTCATTGAIAGQVRDLDGQPVPDAFVTATLGSLPPQDFVVQTDPTGNHVIDQLPVGSYEVATSCPYGPVARVFGVDLVGGQTIAQNLDIDCPPAVLGTVAFGEPGDLGTFTPTLVPPGIEVEITSLSTGSVIAESVRPDGTYGPVSLEADDYSVILNAGSCSPSGGGDISVRQQSQQAMDFTVDCPATVAGTLWSPGRSFPVLASRTVRSEEGRLQDQSVRHLSSGGRAAAFGALRWGDAPPCNRLAVRYAPTGHP